MHIIFFRQACSIHQLRKSQEESRQLDYWFRNGMHFNDLRAKKTPPVPKGLNLAGILTIERAKAFRITRFNGTRLNLARIRTIE